MVAPARQRFSFDSYLLLEQDSNVKHEFLAGEAWAMAGGSPEHAAIAVNVSATLHAQLRDRPCRVYSSNLRVRVTATGLATYPDVTVICAEPAIDPEDRKRQTVTNPTLVVEVLSPSTEDYDRGEKLEHYKQIPSLREVVLVAHETRLLVVWRRSQADEWIRDEYREGAVAKLASIGCELSIADVYATARG